MKKIQLTGGILTKVDSEDYETLSKSNWYLSKGYACALMDYGGQKKQMKMHRIILTAPEGVQVDHINMDKLDNRRCNLRFATNSQNQMNRGMNKNNKSGFKGVSFNTEKNRWQAYIGFKNKRYLLGRFKEKIKAAKAYREAVKLFHNEFSRIK